MKKVITRTFGLLLVMLIACQPAPVDQIKLEENPEAPTLFGEGMVSTNLYERDIAIAPAGNEIIYTLGDFKQTRRCLVKITKEENTWSAPEVLSFSGENYQDIEPFYSPDGTKLFFASNRPIYGNQDRDDYNIWYAEKTAGKWTNPVALDTLINTEGDEFYPALGESGNLYFTATRADGIGREDIFISEYQDETYQQPEPLDSMINSAVYEFNAYVNPEETLLIFSSYGREDDLGGSDLYYAEKDENGHWTAAKHFDAPINSDKLDYCPFVDYQNGNLYFTSERTTENNEPLKTLDAFIQEANKAQNGFGNIYRISLEKAGLK